MFLRQLGDFKIPAVMERRRKGLLDKLLELQGDTFRGDASPKRSEPEDKPPPPEPATEKVKSPEPDKKDKVEEKREKKDKVEEKREKTPTRDSVTSPTRHLSRGDSKISALVGNYEQITTLAKKEEVAETPKRFVQLKKVAKPDDFPDPDKNKIKEEEPKEEEEEKEKPAAPKELEVEKVAESAVQPSPKLRRKGKDNKGLTPERPSSTVSEDSADVGAEEEEEEGEEEGGEKESGKKKRFKGFKRLGDKLKKKPKGRDKSPSRAVEDEDEKNGGGSEVEEADKEETVPQELEEGVKISGTLERKVASKFKSKWVKVNVKLKDNELLVGEKERIELAGYIVACTDIGFDVVHHAKQKQIRFKVEGGENGKERWVEAINAAIEESTPEQEGKPGDTFKLKKVYGGCKTMLLLLCLHG